MKSTKRGAFRGSDKVPGFVKVLKVLPFCIDTAGGVLLSVRVIPRARKTEIAGTRDAALLVRLAAPPVDGAANDALIEVLSARLGVPRRAIRILSGERGRQKRIAIAGVTTAFVLDRLRT